MDFKHISVLPKEVREAFSNLKKGSLIVDGTLGGGGHSKILLNMGFKVVGIDRDEEALEAAKQNLKEFEGITFVHGNFTDLKRILSDLNVKKVDGMLLDLGVSTHQLENKERGFGFQGNLDMRMDKTQALTAEKIVNEWPAEKISEMLYRNGERVHNQQIAGSIARYRQNHRISTGGQLLKLVKFSMTERYRKSRKHHWATPTFRALSIEVNGDYRNLGEILKIFPEFLNKNGIFAAITFHSIEGGIVENHFERLKRDNKVKILAKSGIVASKEEIETNPKSKRAVLWLAIRR